MAAASIASLLLGSAKRGSGIDLPSARTPEMQNNLASPYFAPGTKPRTAEVVLYVDFDGVLHHEAVLWKPRSGAFVCQKSAPGHTLFEWAHYLEEALAEYPEVGLVLSSSWCVWPGYGKAMKRLSPSLRTRFLGGTFHRRHHGADPWVRSAFQETPRWRQIFEDANRRTPGAWLAIDDDVDGWPVHLWPNLVACDGSVGLSSKQVRAELRNKLANALRRNGKA